MKIVNNNLPKQLLFAICGLFVVVSSLNAACIRGICRKKQPRTHQVGGCATGRCGK